MSSAVCLSLDQSKSLSSVNGLTLSQTNKISDQSKLKEFANDKVNVNE